MIIDKKKLYKYKRRNRIPLLWDFNDLVFLRLMTSYTKTFVTINIFNNIMPCINSINVIYCIVKNYRTLYCMYEYRYNNNFTAKKEILCSCYDEYKKYIINRWIYYIFLDANLKIINTTDT